MRIGVGLSSQFPWFSKFFKIITTVVTNGIPHYHLTYVPAVELQWRIPNMNMILGPTYTLLTDTLLCWRKQQQHIHSRVTQITNFMGPTMWPSWVLSAPGGRHDGPMNLAIREVMDRTLVTSWLISQLWQELKPWSNFEHTDGSMWPVCLLLPVWLVTNSYECMEWEHINILYIRSCTSYFRRFDLIVDTNLMWEFLSKALTSEFAEKASTLVAKECSHSVDLPEGAQQGIQSAAQVSGIALVSAHSIDQPELL